MPNKETIYLYNNGKHSRDFTHVSDIVETIFILSKKIKSHKGHELFNICSNKKIRLSFLIKSLEKNLKLKAKTQNVKKQKGDMRDTLGSNVKIRRYTNKNFFTNFELGLKETIENDNKWSKFKK